MALKIIESSVFHHKPVIAKIARIYPCAEFALKKISRKRYIRIIMALGVPAREAQYMAKSINQRGISYQEGLKPTLRAILDVTDSDIVKFWIYIWKIKGFA